MLVDTRQVDKDEASNVCLDLDVFNLGRTSLSSMFHSISLKLNYRVPAAYIEINSQIDILGIITFIRCAIFKMIFIRMTISKMTVSRMTVSRMTVSRLEIQSTSQRH